VLAAGASVACARSGLALSVGGQRLMTAGQPAQLVIAMSSTRIGRGSAASMSPRRS
jgi:hypothetical protein